ncbi:MAG: hypothetical protein AAFY66_05225 [Pseudomonadota bacterium]
MRTPFRTLKRRIAALAGVLACLSLGAPVIAATGDQPGGGTKAIDRLGTVGSAIDLAFDLCIAFRGKPSQAINLARGMGFEQIPDHASYARAAGARSPGETLKIPEENLSLAEGYFALYAPSGTFSPARATLAITLDKRAATCLFTAQVDQAPRNLSSVSRLGDQVLQKKGTRSTCFGGDAGPPLRILRGWGGPVNPRGCDQERSLAAAQCCWFELSYRPEGRGAHLHTLIHLGGGKR